MKSPIFRLGFTLFLFAGVAGLLAGGCNQGGEGDRCVPYPNESDDECGSGLKCTQPPKCPENYCCPANGKSSNPNCQPGCNGGGEAMCSADPSLCAHADAGKG